MLAGCNSFRLSLEWSRLFPRRGELDEDAVARYHQIFDTLERCVVMCPSALGRSKACCSCRGPYPFVDRHASACRQRRPQHVLDALSPRPYVMAHDPGASAARMAGMVGSRGRGVTEARHSALPRLTPPSTPAARAGRAWSRTSPSSGSCCRSGSRTWAHSCTRRTSPSLWSGRRRPSGCSVRAPRLLRSSLVGFT